MWLLMIMKYEINRDSLVSTGHYMHKRESSWSTLRNIHTNKGIPWFVCGDFDEIMYGFKKNRGLPRDKRRMESFRNVLADCHLMDMGFSGKWFTLEKGILPETNI